MRINNHTEPFSNIDIPTSIRGKFVRLLEKHQLDDPAWVFGLDDFDEPPLFLTYGEMDFLKPFPKADRNLWVVSFMIEQLEKIAKTICNLPGEDSRKFDICVTLHGFDAEHSEECASIQPAFFISPKPPPKDSWTILTSPKTKNARRVEHWIKKIGASKRFEVAEIDKDDFERIYILFRKPPCPNIITRT